MNRFENKIAVVTGGCRGIGKSIVEKLASEGAKVFALDYTLPDVSQGFSGNSEIDKKITLIQADVTSEESVKEAFDKAIAEGGRLDILVNNAGITRDTLLMRMSVEQWDSVISTNLKGAFLCTKAAIKPMMSQKSGAIINIGSIVGTIGNAGQANYSSSKAGLIGFTKSLAKELGGRNITANCISPGFVMTPMTEKLTEDQKNQYLENIPLKRAALPEDIANVVAFFASDEASYVTGQVLHVDGGLAM